VSNMRRTKVQVLQARYAQLRDEAATLARELNGLKKTKTSVVRCRTCGQPFDTEWDFATHYVVDDERYLNLGNCPSRYQLPLTNETVEEAYLYNEVHYPSTEDLKRYKAAHDRFWGTGNKA
jgi:hypothetical protein